MYHSEICVELLLLSFSFLSLSKILTPCCQRPYGANAYAELIEYIDEKKQQWLKKIGNIYITRINLESLLLRGKHIYFNWHNTHLQE